MSVTSRTVGAVIYLCRLTLVSIVIAASAMGGWYLVDRIITLLS